MKILALDPATLTGFAYGENPAVELSGTWNLGKYQPDRLAKLRTLILTFHKLHPFQKIAAEAAYYGSKFQSTKQFHNELRCVVRMSANELHVPFVEYQPSTVKLNLTGFGRAKKDQMVRACMTVFGIEVVDENEADAVGVLVTAWNDRGLKKPKKVRRHVASKRVPGKFLF